MSTQAVQWALYTARTAEAAHKLVLLTLANHAHRDGTNAYPSAATIAEATQLSVRTVQRYLVALEDDGLIRRGEQAAADGIPAQYRPIVYDLAMPQVRHDDVSTGRTGTSPGTGQVRHGWRSDTSLVTYKPSTNQELNRGAPRDLSTGGQPPTLAALRAAERDLCPHEAVAHRCALCRIAEQLTP